MAKTDKPPMHLRLMQIEGLALEERPKQRALFAVPKTNTLFLVDMSAVSDHEFLSMMRDVGPRHVLDCRVIPRFDIGRLNRKAAFRLFAERMAEYHDVFGLLGIESKRSAQLSSGEVAAFIAKLLSIGDGRLKGPLMVLLEDLDTVSVSSRVFEGLPPTNGMEWEIQKL